MAEKNESLPRNAGRFVINLSVRNILAGVVVYSCWIPIVNYNYWFSWHVILCTIGMLPFMAEALMLFAPDELWTTQLTRNEKYWIHGALITFGTILVTVGCVYTYIFIEPGYHLYTAHGITGLVSMILFLLSIILGYFANYSQQLKTFARPVVIKLVHNVCGLLGYIIGIMSLCFAYYSNWFVYYTSAESRLVALIATIIGTTWTVNAALVSLYNQVKTVFNNN